MLLTGEWTGHDEARQSQVDMVLYDSSILLQSQPALLHQLSMLVQFSTLRCWHTYFCTSRQYLAWPAVALLKASEAVWELVWYSYSELCDTSANWCVFTVLHGMQTRSSDENSVCPSVCLSVRPSVCNTRVLWQNGRKICPDFYTIRKNI